MTKSAACGQACIGCRDFPCQGVDQAAYRVPQVTPDAERVRLIMISEAAAADAADDYYAPGVGPEAPLFVRTTLQAFQLAGADVTSLEDLLAMGAYLTTAIKCGKVGYSIKAAPIRACSLILERELAQFPGTQVLMLMGDVAIQSINQIARRHGEPRVIPTGATYKIRGGNYSWRHMRVFPSYLQAGRAFSIEASKRRMIAEDLGAALALLD